MKKAFVGLALGFFLLVSSARAQDKNLVQTSTLSDRCADFERVSANDLHPLSALEAIGFGNCLGYFEGLIEGLAVSKYTIVPGATLSPVAAELAFRLYVNQHPEKLHQDAISTVLAALLNAHLIEKQ